MTSVISNADPSKLSSGTTSSNPHRYTFSPSLQTSSATQSHTPRTLSIRFAPLPDPRASRPLLTSPGGVCVWWSREEKPDGNWGEYRLVTKRPSGEVVPVDDLEDPIERKAALDAYDHQHLLSQFSHGPLKKLRSIEEFYPASSVASLSTSDQDHHPSSRKPSVSSGSSHNHPTIPQALDHQTATELAQPGSLAYPGGFPLHQTASLEAASVISASSFSNFPPEFPRRESSTTSITKKLLGAVTKPLKQYSKNRLTSSASLPTDIQPTTYGAPLIKTRSADSTTSSKRRSFRESLNLNLRRSRSKEDTLNFPPVFSTQLIVRNSTSPGVLPDDHILNHFEAERVRRRSKYPPVAQRKLHMGGGRGGAGKMAVSEEPAFVEWGAPSSVALVNSMKTRSSSKQGISAGTIGTSELTKHDSIEDDGSGMAWLKKRKREREERARREAEERARTEALQLMASSPTSDDVGFSLSAAPTSPVLQSAQSDSCPESNFAGDTPQNIIHKPEDESASSASRDGEDQQSDQLECRRRPSLSTNDSSEPSTESQTNLTNEDQTSSSNDPQTKSDESYDDEEDEEPKNEDEDLDEEELKEEERLKAKAMMESPFLKGATEVFKE